MMTPRTNSRLRRLDLALGVVRLAAYVWWALESPTWHPAFVLLVSIAIAVRLFVLHRVGVTAWRMYQYTSKTK